MCASIDTSAANDELDFVTLGMFIIDEIHYQPPKPPVKDIAGGAGTYAAFGARVFSPPPLSSRVGWIVDAGNDFPSHLREEITRWQTSCLLRETPWRPTTRGWNGYDANEDRGFKYITPKLRLNEESLDDRFLASRSFHLICSPLRCIDLITKIQQRRSERLPHDARSPLWIWEPVPDVCTLEELENCRNALKLVDIVSPNHSELCSFFGKQGHDLEGKVQRDSVETCCLDWLDSGIGRRGQGAVVVRAGRDGCCIMTRGSPPKWIPSYHENNSRAVDPTGAGNSFTGAMCVAVARRQDFYSKVSEHVQEAALLGSVAASFAIEQVGLPKLQVATDTKQELWNEDSAWSRLERFRQRTCHVETQ